jgi:outer membrane putative beta-barrel porin/alpha-amylase
MRRAAIPALVAAALFASNAAAADKSQKSEAADAADELDVSAKLAYDWTSGKYGRLRNSYSSIGSVTVTADYGDWSADLVVPYVHQSGPGRLIVIPGRRPVVILGPDEKVSGIGDATAGLTRYLLNQEDHGVDVDVGVIVKFPTASADKGLGTGKYDYSAQLAVAREWRGLNVTLTGGYTVVGKVEGQDYHNAFYESLDVAYDVTKAFSIGATYSNGASIIPGTPASRDAQLYLTYKTTKRTKIEVYYLKGYTIQSPDRGAGISASLDF